MLWRINGDARALPIKDKSVQCVVTSPPYWGLRNYGVVGQLGLESTPQEYAERVVAAFREVHRVLRDDGTVWLNLGDSYASQPAGNFGPEMAKPGDGGIYRENKPKMNYRAAGLKPKDLVGIPWMIAFALRADGWYLRQDIIWAKPNPMPESVTDRPTKSHEYLFLLTKNARYYYDAKAIREESVDLESYKPRSPRSPSQPKSPKYTDSMFRTRPCDSANGKIYEYRNARSVWTIATQPTKMAHFATFPEALVRPCILAGSRSGDTVLDPFAGTGTVGKVALEHGRKAVMVELKREYLLLDAKKRQPQIGMGI